MHKLKNSVLICLLRDSVVYSQTANFVSWICCGTEDAFRWNYTRLLAP